jgi:hypothetical protein
MKSKCKLCHHNKELKESHVIPSFVGKWLKKTSATGYLTAVDTEGSSERSQDLYKTQLLCNECEGIISQHERYFATNIFYPFKNGSLDSININEHISKFAVSVSLRVLWLLQDTSDPLANKWGHILTNLEQEWRQYLFSSADFVKGSNSHHILFSNEYLLAYGLKSAPNLILNLLRTSVFYIYEKFGKAYIFSNLAGIQIISMIAPSNLPTSIGTQIYPKQTLGGQSPPSIGWGGYFQNIMEFSNEVDEVRNGLPTNQKEMIERAVAKDPKRAINSEDAKLIFQQQELLKKLKTESDN